MSAAIIILLVDANKSGACTDLILGIVAKEHIQIIEVEEVRRVLDYGGGSEWLFVAPG